MVTPVPVIILIALASVGAAVLLMIDGNLSRIIGRTAFSLSLIHIYSIVGCVAVYPYPEHHSAELGCLYIKHRHEGRGYGLSLIHI